MQRSLRTPWNILYASYDPERVFSHLLIEHANLFEILRQDADRGVYSFPYSYKPANVSRHMSRMRTSTQTTSFVGRSNNVLVVEIKGEEDRDKNRSCSKNSVMANVILPR